MTDLLYDLNCKIDEWFFVIVAEQHAHLDLEDVTERNAQEFLQHLILCGDSGFQPFFHYLLALYDSTGVAGAVYNSLTLKHAVLMTNEITDHWKNTDHSFVDVVPPGRFPEKVLVDRYLEVYLHKKFLCGCNNLVDCMHDALLAHCSPPHKKMYKEAILWKQLADLKVSVPSLVNLDVEGKRILTEKEDKLMKELKEIVEKDDVVDQLMKAKMDIVLLQSENLKLTTNMKNATKVSTKMSGI
jgi:hypothetical protein